jgi:hypothetical protein
MLLDDDSPLELGPVAVRRAWRVTDMRVTYDSTLG